MTDRTDLIDSTELAPQEVGELDLYQKREKIYTRKIEGFFQQLRVFTGWPLLLGYFLLPWLNWTGHRQAVLFDLPNRQFHILGLTFWPQDFPMLAWLLIIAAFTLFAVTNFAGRVWCGYTCPQTVWTSIFMWAEQVTEGSRNQRIKLDQAPWSVDKFLRKAGKHILWVGVAALTGITFVGYFSPIRELVVDLALLRAGFWEYAWVVFFTCATYINAGWMREQVCLYVCPYARFQSAMFDQDTLIVSYDARRGEPRGSRKRGAERGADGKGDCIDCQLCVQVCPTGIDIRNGLQYQCIGCALCIDACNSVMDKMNYPRGLISYTTEHALQGGTTRVLRPRLVGYVVAIVVMSMLFAYTMVSRIPLRLEVSRDRTSLYTETAQGMVENIYTLKVMNMSQQPERYRLSATGLEGLQYLGETEVLVRPGEVFVLPVRLQADPANLPQDSNKIDFTVQSISHPDHQRSGESRFIGPTGR